jgi:hypothetical protein
MEYLLMISVIVLFGLLRIYSIPVHMTIEVKEYIKNCVLAGILIIGIRFSCAMLSNQINIFDDSNKFIIEWIVVTLYYL